MLTFWRAAVGKKIVMAITGVIMIAFLIGHVVGNLLVFRGAAGLNAYAAFLKHNLGVLWTVRVVLLVSVVLHVVAAAQLTAQSRRSRAHPYKRFEPQAATPASRTMRWGGVIIAAFIVFHLLHLTTGTIQPAPFEETEVFRNMVGGFQVWWIALLYVIAMIFIGLHLYHGGWSWLRSLGLVRPSAEPLHRPIAAVLAFLIWAGFTSIPLAIFFGLVR
ncbi:MAG TPA: succinate dehydrogenase cytochrome b subunit [Myxococcales bacterium]|nr:succinate dehydrogenase cytochrome b subunit [Myxococcales bacterium]